MGFGLDATFNGQIFRKDHPMILASNRHLATIYGVRLKNDTNGYLAGQVLAFNTVSSEYEKYSEASGSYDAKCILFDAIDAGTASTGTFLARGIFGGEVFYDKLTDIDSGAITDLGARVIQGSDGVDVLKF